VPIGTKRPTYPEASVSKLLRSQTFDDGDALDTVGAGTLTQARRLTSASMRDSVRREG
jgi:hypothetical protein